MGVYISGHPLDDVAESWRRNVTAVTSDFYVNEEIGMPNVVDQSLVVIGGMVTGKTVKSTKEQQDDGFYSAGGSAGNSRSHYFSE